MSEQGTFFKECTHSVTVFMPEKNGPHHGKALCRDCGKFMGWVAKPETIERQLRNAATLTMLSKRDDLGPWERQFVRSISGLKHLSPKQQKILDDLREHFSSEDNK